MNPMTKKKGALMVMGLMTALLFFSMAPVHAAIDGVTGTSPNPAFSFVAKPGNITLGDGSVMHMWGFAMDNGGPMQYPGPTLILNQGDNVSITLRNLLPAAAGTVSILFPGHQVSAAGGVDNLFTRGAPPGGTNPVTYSFTATDPGTYFYHAGTDLQAEMGLAGAIIVRSGLPPQPDPLHAAMLPDYPSMFPDLNFAYNHAATAYHREFLYFLTETDPVIHHYVATGQYDRIDFTRYFATAWFINGRNFPDVMSESFVPWLPNQPYNIQPRAHPYEKALLRIVGAGRDLHPMHYHGANFAVIAQDGRLLTTTAGAPSNAPPDIQWGANTIRVTPGQTADAIWTWTGEKLGWDIYGHLPTDPLPPFECVGLPPGDPLCDHGKPFPVIIPPRDDLTFGPLYSGSPFLGGGGPLPPGHPGLNAGGGFFYMWHSHTEKEICNIGLFPGGLISFMIIEHPAVIIP